MNDDDIAHLLPEPPPPRPVARAAAIAHAMQRFDETQEPATPATLRTPSGWWRGRRAQIGAFASIALVAIVALPLALERQEGLPPGSEPLFPESVSSPTKPAPAAAPARSGDDSRADAAVQRPVAARAPGEPAAARRIASGSGQAAAGSEAAEAAPAPAPALPASGAEARAQAEPIPPAPIVVTGSRIAAREAASVSAVTVVTGETLSDSRDVVVTGTRLPRARSKAARRGDWNACTVEDPQQSLSDCKRLVNPDRKGISGAAAKKLAEGLERAWQGDLSGAIAAMDEALALKPKFAFAYLNRGIAHAREGDLDKAASDLDLAVRYAPHAARGYYHRSVVKRMRGDAPGAKEDAAQAEALDPRYVRLTQ